MRSAADLLFRIHTVGGISDLFKSQDFKPFFFVCLFIFSSGDVSEAPSYFSRRSEEIKMYSEMNTDDPLQFPGVSSGGWKRKHYQL